MVGAASTTGTMVTGHRHWLSDCLGFVFPKDGRFSRDTAELWREQDPADGIWSLCFD